MALTNIIWEFPSPSSGFLNGAKFQVLPKRACSLSFQYEDPDGLVKSCALLFHGVETFKCTYLSSLTAEIIETSYDKLVDVGDSPWLQEIKKIAGITSDSLKLQHLRVCFDDGPCYEFICKRFDLKLES